MQSFRVLLLVLALVCTASAFAPTSPSSSVRQSIGVLSAKKPTFNKSTQKWEPASGDDGKYPYDAIGSFLRFGTGPFLKRVTDANGYEQDVLEYMAGTGASRAEATGNMDAKLFNPADWAYQKVRFVFVLVPPVYVCLRGHTSRRFIPMMNLSFLIPSSPQFSDHSN